MALIYEMVRLQKKNLHLFEVNVSRISGETIAPISNAMRQKVGVMERSNCRTVAPHFCVKSRMSAVVGCSCFGNKG